MSELSYHRIFSRRGRWIFTPLAVIAFLNFAVFWIVAVHLGGDAINGAFRDGHYYLASHGRSPEVSRAVWTYSYYHTISVWVTHGLAFAAAVILRLTGDIKR